MVLLATNVAFVVTFSIFLVAVAVLLVLTVRFIIRRAKQERANYEAHVRDLTQSKEAS